MDKIDGYRRYTTDRHLLDDRTARAAPFAYRYSGAQLKEGAFLACSFWLVEATPARTPTSARLLAFNALTG